MHHRTGDASSLSDFDLAAIACGHDPSTNVGAAAARADHRVWDLLDAAAIEQHIADARTAIANSTAVSW